MTTYSFSTANSAVHTDARFRTMGSAINTALAAVGLVQTADTGQINWSTVAHPNLATSAGYEIWRFNDSLQGTSPIYIKIEYRAGNSGGADGSDNNLQLRWSIGTGSNGSGTLTGSTLIGLSTSTDMCNASQGADTTAHTSYMCMVNGQFSFAFNTLGAARGFVGIYRTNDASNGNDTSTGAFFCITAAGANLICSGINYSSSTNVFSATSSANNWLRIGNVASSLIGGDYQAYVGWNAMPTPQPQIAVCGTIAGEFSGASTFTATLFGSTSHTYLSMNALLNGSIGAGSGLQIAFLWE